MIGLYSCYNARTIDNYVNNNMPLIEKAASMPLSEKKDLRFNYEKLYQKKYFPERK